MTSLWFLLFTVLLVSPLLAVIRKPERVYQYPYFMAATFGVFILPQAVSFCRFPGAAPPEAVETVLLVTCLCLAACLLGYRLFAPSKLGFNAKSPVNEARLFHAGLVFVGSGIAFSYLLAHIEVQTSEAGGWTGPATIYGFFQQLCYPGFAICFMLAIRRATLISITATALAGIVPIQSIVYGRREPAALFALTIGLTLYFQTRLRPPRWLILAGLVGGMLAIPATGTYRRFQLQNDWEAVRQIDLTGNFDEFLNQESVLELRNAAMLIEATRRSGEYQYGTGYWDHLVFRYIPAQLLGESFKKSLMVRRSAERVELELAGMDYTNPSGSTVTAMGDSFQQFGYWGCLFFAGVAILFHRLWFAAQPTNALFYQLLYTQSCTCAMRAVTHWTLDFVPGLVYNAIFLGAALLYAASKPMPGLPMRAGFRRNGTRLMRGLTKSSSRPCHDPGS